MLWRSRCALFCDRIRIKFSVSLTIEPEDDETVLFGKAASDLQSSVDVDGNHNISGVLKYVTGYVGFSDTAEEQVGNFLALNIGSSIVGGVTTADLRAAGVSEKLLTVGETGSVVFRITDPQAQTIVVKTILDGEALTTVYNLSGLVLTKVPLNLTVTKEVATVEPFGKKVSVLQTNITITDLAITGTSNYVEGYEGFSTELEMQEGNYLAFHVACTRPEAVIYGVVYTGEDMGDYQYATDDGTVVVRITDAATQTISISVVDGQDVKRNVYTIAALTLAAKA